MNDIEDTRPQFESIRLSRAVVSSTQTTYNSSTVTYSSASQIYGGVDRTSDLGPVMASVLDATVKNESVIDF